MEAKAFDMGPIDIAWCPGCGNFAILKALKEALAELDLDPTQVVLAETEQGRGILGVVDGASPLGVEDEAGIAWRHDILRKFGYKK